MPVYKRLPVSAATTPAERLPAADQALRVNVFGGFGDAAHGFGCAKLLKIALIDVAK